MQASAAGDVGLVITWKRPARGREQEEARPGGPCAFSACPPPRWLFQEHNLLPNKA